MRMDRALAACEREVVRLRSHPSADEVGNR